MWNLVSSSKYLQEKDDLKRLEKLGMAIRNARGAIDMKSPKIPYFLKSRQKQKVMRQIQNNKVYFENTILLNKINEIYKHDGKLSKTKLQKKQPTFQSQLNAAQKDSVYARPSTAGIQKQRFENQIYEENKEILTRIKSVKTFYCKEKMIKNAMRHSKLGRNISQNARRNPQRPISSNPYN